MFCWPRQWLLLQSSLQSKTLFAYTQYNAKWPISLRCRLCVATTDKSSKSHCYVLCSSICLQQEFNHNYVTAFIPVSYLVFLALTQARKLFSNLLTLPTFSIPHIRSTKICKISSFEDLTFLILGFLEVSETKTLWIKFV